MALHIWYIFTDRIVKAFWKYFCEIVGIVKRDSQQSYQWVILMRTAHNSREEG